MITYLPARSKRSRPGVRRLVTAVLTALLTVLALGLAGAVPAKAAADYTQDVTSTGSGSVQIWFKPTTPRPWSTCTTCRPAPASRTSG